MNSFFQFYSNIFIFYGVKRSIIFDTQFKKHYFISNFIFQLIKDNVINLNYKDRENQYIIEKWISYFIENDLGFFTENTNYFPKISNEFYFEGNLSNLILELSNLNSEIIITEKFINKLQFLGIKAITVTQEEYNFDDIIKLLDLFKNTNFEHIEMYLNSNFCKETFIELVSKEMRVRKITFIDAEKNDYNISLFGYERIVFDKVVNNSLNKLCGNTIIHNSFINIKNITESNNHNSCLHKKISIDKQGYIRNCPSMPQHFGNIKDNSLEEALNHPDFKKYWNVTKDMIEVCKDCEFRHICTDCRAYTERTHFEEDIDLSKPLKCGYNPYTNEWAEWSTNSLKQSAIEYYDMQELVKKEA